MAAKAGPQSQFFIEAADAEGVAVKMDALSETVTIRMLPTMYMIGATWAKEAKAIATASGSQSIPPTIKYRSVPEGVEVSAGGGDVAIASLWELGNKGSKKSAKTFRHPIFGDWDIETDGGPDPRVQQKHPFLTPARRRTLPETNKLLKAGWEAALSEFKIPLEWEGMEFDT